MSRDNSKIKYRTNPDLVYGDHDIEKFINTIMIHGKKVLARNIVYGALDDLHRRINERSLSISELFEKVLKNVMPTVEVRRKRVGGATYQVPVELKERRAKVIAMRFFHAATKKTRKRTTMESLANEMYEAYNGRGEAMKMKDEKHKVAKANMSYAHYR